MTSTPTTAETAARVTLIDGRSVSSWSPEWLEETRARHAEALIVLDIEWKEGRQAHIARYGEDHGDIAKSRLEAEVMAIWRSRQEKWAPA